MDKSKTWNGALFDVQKSQNGGGVVYDHSYTYTPFGAVWTSQETIQGNAYTVTYGYDPQGRVNSTTYPNGFALTTGYNNYGAENSISQTGTGGQVFWSGTSWDQWGVSSEALGNGAVKGVTRDAAIGTINQISEIPAQNANGGAAIANLSYGWDADRNITQRVNGVNGQNEAVNYDNENRMQTDTVSNPSPPAGTVALSNYDSTGNLGIKNGGQGYVYGTRTYAWTTENQLANINDAYLGQLGFLYGADGSLVSQTETDGGVSSVTTQHVGSGLADYIASGSMSGWKNYIRAPTGETAMVVQSSNQADAVQYLQTDNQGSVTAVTDDGGNVIQQYAYDPYGRRFVTSTASGYSGLLTDIGYTGHRQLDYFNLVHMRGRVYDPTMARFFSADPNIQSPTNAQSLNRYAYVWNNPLTFTDPSGYFLSGFFHWFGHNWMPFAEIAVIIAAPYVLGPMVGMSAADFEASYGAFVAAAGGFAAGMIGSNGNFVDGLEGATFGVMNYGIGSAVQGDYVGGIVAHGVLSGMQSDFSGGTFGSGFLAGAVQAATSQYMRGPDSLKIAESAIIGGSASAIGGGKFSNGAITAAFAEAFNDLLHPSGPRILNTPEPGVPSVLIRDEDGNWMWVAQGDAGAAVAAVETHSPITAFENPSGKDTAKALAVGLGVGGAVFATGGTFGFAAGATDIAAVYGGIAFTADVTSLSLDPSQEGVVSLGFDLLPMLRTAKMFGWGGEMFLSILGSSWSVGTAVNSCQPPNKC